MNRIERLKFTIPALGLLVATATVFAEASAGAEEASAASSGGDADLAQELTNPLANLVTMPIQMSFYNDIGLADAGPEGLRFRLQANIVLPR